MQQKYQVLVSGIDPHIIASQMCESYSPFRNCNVSVSQSFPSGGGVIVLYAGSQLTSEQLRYIRVHPRCDDIRRMEIEWQNIIIDDLVDDQYK